MIQGNTFDEVKEEFTFQNNLGSNSKFTVSVTTVMDVYCGCTGLISKLRSCGSTTEGTHRPRLALDCSQSTPKPCV